MSYYRKYGKKSPVNFTPRGEKFFRNPFSPRHCVLALPFDEGAGSIAYDKSGNGNNGTIYGATWVDGKFGKALSFNGSTDYVEVPHSSSLYLDGDFTVLVWATLERTPIDYGGVIDKGRNSFTDFYFLSIPGNNCFLWGIFFIDNTKLEQWFPAVTLGQWNFYAFGVEGSNMFTSFNGGAKTYNAFTKTRKIGTLRLTLGCRNDFTIFEKVKLDQGRVYSRALSEDEISDLYNYYNF